MHYNRKKQQIVLDNPELVLCENGDFKIKADLVEQYEIIDMHCHIFNGLSQLFPPILQKEKSNNRKSLMGTSCFIIVGSKEQRKMIASANLLHKAIKNSQMKILEGYYHGEMSMKHAKEYVKLLEEVVNKSDGTERIGYEKKDTF